MDGVYSAQPCTAYTSCWSCVSSSSRCGYFDNTGSCVPGGWLNPQANYTASGDVWRYFHGQCYVSTRVEFVLLPAVLGLAVLAAAVVAVWRCVPARWCGLGPGEDDTLSCTTSEAGSYYGDHHHSHRHHHHRAEEHMPLLIDSDPASRQPAGAASRNADGGSSHPAPVALSTHDT